MKGKSIIREPNQDIDKNENEGKCFMNFVKSPCEMNNENKMVLK